MKIQITQSLKPFAVTPGMWCLIPYSHFAAQISPCRILIYDLTKQEQSPCFEYTLHPKKTKQNFLITQDFEKGVITIDRDIRMHLLPDGTLVKQKKVLKQHQMLTRVSFGSAKKLFWEKCILKYDPLTLLPLLFTASEGFDLKFQGERGVFTLLKQLEVSIAKKEATSILDQLESIFKVGFKGMFVPRLFDDQYQGIVAEPAKGSPLAILVQLHKLLLNLFFIEQKNGLKVLPCLPPELHAGKILNLETTFGSLDLEWSKKQIKKMIFRSSKEQEIELDFPSYVKNYRLKIKDCSKEQILNNRVSLAFKAGKIYYLDRFRK